MLGKREGQKPVNFPGSQTLSLRITSSLKQCLGKDGCDLDAVISAFCKLPALRLTAHNWGPRQRCAWTWVPHSQLCTFCRSLALLLSNILLELNNIEWQVLFYVLPYFNTAWCNACKQWLIHLNHVSYPREGMSESTLCSNACFHVWEWISHLSAHPSPRPKFLGLIEETETRVHAQPR